MKPKFRNSIVMKIMSSSILIVLFFVGITSIIFLTIIQKQTAESLELNMKNKTQSIVYSLENRIKHGGNLSKENLDVKHILENNHSSDILEMRVYDSSTRLIASIPEDTSSSEQIHISDKKETSFFTEDPVSKKKVHINTQEIVNSEGQRVGLLYIKSSLITKDDLISRLETILIRSSIVSIAISSLVAFLVSFFIVKPIKGIEKHANKLKDGDFKTKIRVSGNDELSLLSTLLNKLSDSIGYSLDEIEFQKTRLDSILHHMSDGVLSTDRRGRIVTANNVASLLLNMEKEDLVRQSIFSVLNTEKMKNMRSLLNSVNDEFFLKVSSKKSKGEYRVLKVSFSPIRHESGFVTGIVVVLHDSTEHEKSQQKLKKFVEDVSQQLRVPLSNIKDNLITIDKTLLENPELANEFIKTTLQYVNYLIKTVNNLLTISKMDRGELHLNIELVDFKMLLTSLIKRYKISLLNQEKEFDIEEQFDPENVWVDIDVNRIIQVIENILDNAVKYSPNGGAISIRLNKEEEYVKLTISDQGTGISEKDIPYIFERFYSTTIEEYSNSSAGLGLALSREIIEKHGGKIWCTSKKNKGSTFFITLPFYYESREGF